MKGIYPPAPVRQAFYIRYIRIISASLKGEINGMDKCF
ncbi:hypothetical protein A464_1189 [Salmonella bongori N268-08]|uniref:Uncharacterized protein n=1 Tax=Salmonella bongori N268-08 TaxID=1197719 RepID=S5N747_SALBN|nr:hypothetical protein A464_1189 [Salmonella bongori N268-08]